jgi:hypothetical protein
MTRYLVVANQTLAGEPLRREVQSLMRRGPCSFHVVVPATPPREHLTWTEGDAIGLAKERLAQALTMLHGEGAEATGEVGDAKPLLAIDDALRSREVDAIVLSTLPPGRSRWLGNNLPRRIERRFALPLIHVVAEPEPAS